VKPAAALVRQNDTAVTFNNSTREKTNLKELTFLQPAQSIPNLDARDEPSCEQEGL